MIRTLPALLVAALLATACAGTPRTDVCAGPLGFPLERAMNETRNRLGAGCGAHFERYVDELLTLAEDRPSPENRKLFSDALLELADAGLISRRQATGLYTRYFGVKFTSLTGDFNTCAQVCPDRRRVLGEMERELADKERGLVRVAGMPDAYYRADALLRSSELVLEATCRACDAPARGAR